MNSGLDEAEKGRRICREKEGQVYGDKGFINQKVFDELLMAGLKLVTSIRSNMKNKLMLLTEKLLLKKEA